MYIAKGKDKKDWLDLSHLVGKSPRCAVERGVSLTSCFLDFVVDDVLTLLIGLRDGSPKTRTRS